MQLSSYTTLILILIVLKSTDAVVLAPTSKPVKSNPIYLGIDYSDELVSPHLLNAFIDAVKSQDPLLNQYAPVVGRTRLRKAIAAFYSRVISHEINAETEVMVTTGATEALFTSIKTLTSPGDEWIVFEPFYSKYVPQIKMCGGIPICMPLKLTKSEGNVKSSDWIFDRNQLSSLFNSKTRGILFNNPNNPLGKVYTRDELEFIAGLAKQHNVIIITDEPHEWAVYDNKEMIRMASLPDMYERTLSIGSASKAFHVAGWRIGWIFGPAIHIAPMQKIHLEVVLSVNTPGQDAVAFAFEEELKNYGKPESFLQKERLRTQEKRNKLVAGMQSVGMLPIIPDGGHCMIANFPQLDNDDLSGEEGDNRSERFSKWFLKNTGIIADPMTLYHVTRDLDLGYYVRFCYRKHDETISKAVTNLQRLLTLHTK